MQFISVAQSCLTLQTHGLQHTRPPCPSPTPGAYLNSCPLSRWCRPTISPSVIPFSSCLQSSPASSTMPACGGYETDPWQVKCRSNSVQFSRSVVSNSMQPHGLQHARPPCPSTMLGVYPNSCPLSQWCHATISSSIIPFSSCLQSFPASGYFPVSQFFTSSGQSIGVSASASVLPTNIQGWIALGLTGWIFLQSKGLSRVSFPSFEVVCCSMSGSNCCFLTCLQVSQEAGEVV